MLFECTPNIVNDENVLQVFHVVHFECPAQITPPVSSLPEPAEPVKKETVVVSDTTEKADEESESESEEEEKDGASTSNLTVF